MALSLLHQQLPFTNSLFEFRQPSKREAATVGFADLLSLTVLEPMEYANNHLHPPHLRINNSGSNINTDNNNCEQSGSINGAVDGHFINGSVNQHSTNLNRTYVSGYHYQHISHDYEPVINFVDSPPNSETSWTDEQSIGSPGPQIIEVRTLHSNSGTRKRRMDWDPLDIGQGGNPASTRSPDVVNKISHLSGTANDDRNHSEQHEKEKHKKDKFSGRGSWTDDIDFDLNAEFSTNSYLNNESFLTFSTALTVLKQEPQTEQPKENKTLSACATKIDKPLTNEVCSSSSQKSKNASNEPVRVGFSSPQSTQVGCKHNQRPCIEKPDGSKTRTGIGHDSFDDFARNGAAVARSVDENVAATSFSDDHKFQYILAAATSIATKNNEETLTYLNQGQSYEIKLKKTGDLSFYRDKILKSVIKICFHERRLQYMEREQMQQWQTLRPGERIIEVDVPLSYGLCHVAQPLSSNHLNMVEVFWDPLKEVGVYVKVNCISTEFTPKKHGGEKGVPFRLQIETYIENTHGTLTATPIDEGSAPAGALPSPPPPPPLGPPAAAIASGNLTPTNTHVSNHLATGKQPVHAAACQIKVFKLKGADRKHKQDREKIQKRPQSEQGKFQPSYECTIMNDVPLDLLTPSPGCFSPEYMKIWPNSPVHVPKYDGMLSYSSTSPASNSNPIAINNVTSSNSPNLKLVDAANMVSPQQAAVADTSINDYVINIMPEATPAQVTQWLTYHRLTAYLSTFAHFSGSDIMRMSKEDLIQICGLADGIRMFNILRAKAIVPRLTVYVSIDNSSYNAIYLLANTAKELVQKLYKLPGFNELIANSTSLSGTRSIENSTLYNGWGGLHTKYSGSSSNLFNEVVKSSIYVSGPSGVHINITDEVLNNEIKDGSLYALEMQNGKVVMKSVNNNDN